MTTDTAAKIANDPALQAALAKATALAEKATRDEAIAKERAADFDRDVASGAYNGPTGIIVGKFRRHVTQAEVMLEDSRPVRRSAKVAKQSRQAATDAANAFVALLIASH